MNLRKKNAGRLLVCLKENKMLRFGLSISSKEKFQNAVSSIAFGFTHFLHFLKK